MTDLGPPNVTLEVVQHGNTPYIESFREMNRMLLEALNHEIPSEPGTNYNGTILFHLDQANGEPWPSARFAHGVVINARQIFSKQDPKLVESMVFKFIRASHAEGEGTAPNTIADAVSDLFRRLSYIRAWIRPGVQYRTAWEHLDDEAV